VPQLPAAYVNLILKLIFSLLILVLMVVVQRGLRDLLRRRVKDPAQVRTLYMLARNAVFVVGGVGILFVWLGAGSNFSVAMGILGAGIAFASQEVIGSFAGYVNIVTGNLFRIGDRVQIGNVVGDVMDISILRTAVMEIGEWVHADQYTGRIVTVANRVVFSDPVFNYTQHWRYLWDEIMVPVTYDSDWRRAGELMLEHGREYTSRFHVHAQAELRALMEHYPVHEATVEPMLYIVMTDNWIEMTLRYVVEAHARRQVKGQLHHELLNHFGLEPDITVASATVEIVGFPPLRSEGNKPDEL
jgi:hypothetical protein